MTVAASVLDTAGQTLGGFLPRLGGAVVLLVVGLLVARLLSRALKKVLEAVGVDDVGDRTGVRAVLERIGLPGSLAQVIATAIRVSLSLVVVFAALSLLGLQFLSDSLNAGVLYVPRVLAALIILLAGIVIAGVAQRWLDRVSFQMDLPVPLGRLGEVAIIAVAAITAATQLGIATATLTMMVTVILAAAALAFALAFGLGGRDVARAMTAGRYLKAELRVGQEIEVDGVRGRIEAVDSAVTVVRVAGDRTVRYPNALLLTVPVAVIEDPPSPLRG